MPSFSKPPDFVSIRVDIPDTDIPLSISDMTAIVAEHLRLFLDHPESFSGLPHVQSSALLGNLTESVYLETSKLALSKKTDWILILPSSIQHTKIDDIADIGVIVKNNKAPYLAHTRSLTTVAGRILSRESCVLERGMVVLVSLRSVPASFRAADAIYTWLAAMLPIFKLEFGCRQVKLKPVQQVSEKERFLFEPVAGNPLAIGISAITMPSFSYGDPDPA
jgi:hypothetical protein